MEKLNLNEVSLFVNENISVFHDSKLRILENLNLKNVLKKKNPYLFKAKNIIVVSDLITNIMDAFLSSSEEKLFGDFLEDLAIFISGKTCRGRKSGSTGIDLEFDNNGARYLVSIKSGPNWGNNAQHNKQVQDFRAAEKVIKQSKYSNNVQAVLGICYGKTRTAYHNKGYLKVVGQNFWYLNQ